MQIKHQENGRMESRTYSCWSRNRLGTLGICRYRAEVHDDLCLRRVGLKKRMAPAARICRISAWLKTRKVFLFSVCMLAWSLHWSARKVTL